MYKKIIASVLIFVLLMACLVMPSSAASTIYLSDANYPSSHVAGNTFSVYGTISSDYTLTYVWIGAIKSDGTTAFSYNENPQSKSFNIHSIDDYMTFSKLSRGTYTYKIIASNSKESKTVLLAKQFTVSSTSSKFTLENETYPTYLGVGKTFSVYGNLYCDDVITSVTAGVYKTDGTAVFSKTVYPNSTSYNLHNLDTYLTFSKLESGSYTYKVVASTEITKNYTVLSRTFTVGSGNCAEDGLKSVNWTVYDVSSWTTINSWKNFTEGVDAFILRVGYTGTRTGACAEDSAFETNYNKLVSMGIPVGCYYYSLAVTTQEAEEEAQFVINILKKYNCKMNMPIYFDAETEEQMSLSDATMTKVVRAFCDKLTENGYYPGFYCSKSFLTDEVYEDELTDITKWVAQYSSKCYYTGSYGMWQYTDSGDVGGTYDPIDINECYYDYASYIENNGYNGFKKTPTAITSTTTTTVVPKFSIKTGTNLTLSGDKIILKTVGMTTQNFTSTFVTKTSNVTVSYEGAVNGKVTTGTKVIGKTSSATLGTYTVSVLGDVCADGVINSTDALYILRNSVGTGSLTEAQKISSDINCDGKINSSDALEILKKIVG